MSEEPWNYEFISRINRKILIIKRGQHDIRGSIRIHNEEEEKEWSTLLDQLNPDGYSTLTDRLNSDD